MANSIFVRALLAGFLVMLTVVTVFMPDKTFAMAAMGGAVGAGMLLFFFPGFSLILGMASTVIGIESTMFFFEFNRAHPTFLASSSFHKIIALALMMPAIVRYGIKPKPNPVILAFIAIFLATFVFASRLPSLDTGQIVQTLIGLTIPYFVYNLNLQPRWIESHLAVTVSLPIISIVLGYIFEFAGVMGTSGLPWQAWDLEYGTNAHRLQGINIAAGLASYAYIAFYISIFQAILYKKNNYYMIAGLMLVITVFTGTRGPLAAEIIFAGLGILISSNEDMRGTSKLNFAIIGAVMLSVVLIAYWPNLSSRFAPSTGSNEVINTSARGEIWEIELNAWQQNPMFGRGLGAGAIILLDNEFGNISSARATHNEFLRLLLDGGIFGLGAYILGMIILIVGECRGINTTAKRLMFALFLSFAIYSFTDNTISSNSPVNSFYAIALLLFQARLAKENVPRPEPARRFAYA